MNEIKIEEYTGDDKEEVIEMILQIQKNEFNIQIKRDDQPDLENIENYYGKGSSKFWVAKREAKIIGTVAFLDIGGGNAALRKMFVINDFRGKELGVGQLLLNTLLQWAEKKGFASIFLGTTEKFLSAQRFYEKNNFGEVNRLALPRSFPVMGVDNKFYKYSIN